ncbi:TetR/AcrR family transcriptional regulator [Oceanispirochaeta crateris]|uniref:TetR/AcrR family transcriptional regulator n=1 Tax=Oceanispirochaeta crateris TaxID=2518645 RepID=UPI001FE64632|nr:TetR/AcrR family transcriptional regulator [Oceanispirochaeta crateris]
MSTQKTSARERLLNAAANLFYNNGIAATGIDSIIKKAKVAKMSLYNNFSSKDDLVQTYINKRHSEWLDLYRNRLKKSNIPRERVLAVFDVYLDHAAFEYERGFRGCGILNAAAELPAKSRGREAVRKHKDEVEAILQMHLLEYPSMTQEKSESIAEHLSFLLEGAMARAGLEGSSEKIIHAKKLATHMLETL